MSLGRTLSACALAAVLALAAAARLTEGFQIWTSEDARRLETALRPVPAPAIAVEGPGLPRQSLQQLLSGEQAVTIVDFMYTRCTSICAALGSAFQQLQADIQRSGPEAPRLRLLSISFDPAHDEPAVLARYAQSLRADPHIWRFARVADAASAPALLQRYQVTVIADGQGAYEHNAALLIVDTTGRLVRVFDYSELELALAYARHLAATQASSR